MIFIFFRVWGFFWFFFLFSPLFCTAHISDGDSLFFWYGRGISRSRNE